MFETQLSGNKTNSGENGRNIRTHASPRVAQDQVARGVSVFCWHAAPVEMLIYYKMLINCNFTVLYKRFVETFS